MDVAHSLTAGNEDLIAMAVPPAVSPGDDFTIVVKREQIYTDPAPDVISRTKANDAMRTLLCCLLLLQAANPQDDNAKKADDAKKATHAMVEYCRKVGQAKCIQELNQNPALHHYKTIDPKRDLPVGAIIEKKDLDPRRGDFWSTEEEGFATEVDQVRGHMVLKPLHAGAAIRLSEISQ